MRKFFSYFQLLIASHILRQKMTKMRYRGDKSGSIVINTTGCYVPSLNLEFYLGYLMACEGFSIKILMDDFQMPHWDYLLRTKPQAFKFHKSIKNKMIRGFYAFLSQRVFAHPKIQVIWYSEILAKTSELPLAQNDRNHAESSTRKYFQSGAMDISNPEHLEFYNLCLQNAKISKQVGKYVAEILRPSLYLSSHGFYSVWGSAVDYVRDKNVPLLIFNLSPYQKQSLLIYERIVHYMTEDINWKKFRDKKLSETEIGAVDAYFTSRMLGQAQDTRMYYEGMAEYSKKHISSQDTEWTFAIFPNVIWDGDVVERNTVFSSPVDWVTTTIDFFRRHPTFQLIIRFHPAEATIFTTSTSLETIIRSKVPDLDAIKNIKLVSAHEKVDTYQFIRDNVDIGLVFDGMIGLELTYLDKPVILAAQSRMTNAGVAFEPKTASAYLELLEKPEELITDFKSGHNKENLYRFAYWYLFEHNFVLPILDPKKYAYVGFENNLEMLDPASNPQALKIIRLLAEAATPPLAPRSEDTSNLEMRTSWI